MNIISGSWLVVVKGLKVLCKMPLWITGKYGMLCAVSTKCKKTEIIFKKPVDKSKVLCYTI